MVFWYIFEMFFDWFESWGFRWFVVVIKVGGCWLLIVGVMLYNWLRENVYYEEIEIDY